jgi:hypothetical protein
VVVVVGVVDGVGCLPPQPTINRAKVNTRVASVTTCRVRMIFSTRFGAGRGFSRASVTFDRPAAIDDRIVSAAFPAISQGNDPPGKLPEKRELRILSLTRT